eukprot:scaffold22634_cov25-Prasinocladus_malaysianus.AAC.2
MVATSVIYILLVAAGFIHDLGRVGPQGFVGYVHHLCLPKRRSGVNEFGRETMPWTRLRDCGLRAFGHREARMKAAGHPAG